MKDIDKKIEKTFKLSNAEKIINESEILIESLNKLIENTKKIEMIKYNAKFKMTISNKFELKVINDLDEVIESVKDYKELLVRIDDNIENLKGQVKKIKFENK